MKIQKILTWFIILGSILGIIFSTGYISYAGRLFSLVVFAGSLAFGVWYLRSTYENKQLLLLLFFGLQVFSFSTGDFNYVFSVGIGYFNYFEISTMKHTSSFLTSSFLNFWDTAKNNENVIGVNLVPVIIIVWILFFRKKLKLNGYEYRNENRMA